MPKKVRIIDIVNNTFKVHYPEVFDNNWSNEDAHFESLKKVVINTIINFKSIQYKLDKNKLKYLNNNTRSNFNLFIDDNSKTDNNNIYLEASKNDNELKTNFIHSYLNKIQEKYIDNKSYDWIRVATNVMFDEFLEVRKSVYKNLYLFFSTYYLNLQSKRNNRHHGAFIYFKYLMEHYGGFLLIRNIWEDLYSNNDNNTIKVINRNLKKINKKYNFKDILLNFWITCSVMTNGTEIEKIYRLEYADYYLLYTDNIKKLFINDITTSDNNTIDLDEYQNNKFSSLIFNLI